MNEDKLIKLSTQQISRAIADYIKVHQGHTTFKVTFDVETNMTDSAEPQSIGKLSGATVEIL
jgi:hypothetical protein